MNFTIGWLTNLWCCMAHPPNTQERRREIALALRQVMAKKGYDGASIQDIAAAAGLAPGLVHYHYKNKQQILLALLDHLAEHQSERLKEHLEGTSGLGSLDAFINAHLALGRSANPEVLACWIALTGEAIRQPEVGLAFGQIVTGFHQQLVKILQEGTNAGDFRCSDPEGVACAIFAAIQGYYSLAATARPLIPRGSAAGFVRRMARSLLEEPLETA